MGRKKKEVERVYTDVVRSVQFPLTTEEILGYTDEWNRLQSEKDQVEDSKKSYNDQVKAKISSLNANINEVRGKIRDKVEYRTTDCKLSLNLETKRREYYDAVTGELLEDEPFHEGDYQGVLPMEVEEPEMPEEEGVAEVLDEPPVDLGPEGEPTEAVELTDEEFGSQILPSDAGPPEDWGEPIEDESVDY